MGLPRSRLRRRHGVAGGNAGSIYTSNDGINAYTQRADGEFETRDWRAVALADSSHAAVGGIAGALVITDRANTIPDLVKPTGTITGPAMAEAWEPVVFTVAATDNPGGSGLDTGSFSWPANGQATGPDRPTGQLHLPLRRDRPAPAGFRDRAGNSAQATHPITVTAPTGPASGPEASRPRLSFQFPGGQGAPTATTRRDSRGRKLVEIKVRGRLGAPPGVNAALACRGSITITITAKKRLVTARKAKVARNCAYRKTIRFPRSKVRGRRIAVTLEFPGNTAVARSTYRKSLRLKG